MKQVLLTVAEQRLVAADTYRLVLAGDVSAVTRPGQFVNLRLAGRFLRRPISVSERTEDTIVLLYKLAGAGTRALAALSTGAALDTLTGLGNGFDIAPAGRTPLLFGGGIGSAPLVWLAKELAAAGCRVTAALGFNTAADIVAADRLEALGARVLLATADGSRGTKGFVTDAAAGEDYSYFYACGPEAMLRAVFRATRGEGQLSFEERMGCGFGACMGCSCETVAGPKRICRDGPVLRKGELLWTD